MTNAQKKLILEQTLKNSKVGRYGQSQALDGLKYMIDRAPSNSLDSLRATANILTQLLRDGRKSAFISELQLTIIELS